MEFPRSSGFHKPVNVSGSMAYQSLAAGQGVVRGDRVLVEPGFRDLTFRQI